MNALRRPQHRAGVRSVHLAHLVCPDAGGVDDDLGPHIELPTGQLVHHVGTDDAPVCLHQARGAGVVDHNGTPVVGSLGRHQGKAGIVGPAVVEAGRAEQAPPGDQRLTAAHLRRTQPAVALDVAEEP